MALPQKSNSRYVLTSLSTILVLTALVLVGLNAFQIVRNGGFTTKNSYADGYRAARARYAPQPSEARSFTGSVQSVGDSSLVVVQKSLDTNPRVDGVKDERTITVTAETKIQKTTQKDMAQFNAELAAYAKDPKGKQAPLPTTTTDIKLSDIQAGQSVYIESASDVRLSESVTATVIRVL